VQAGSRAKTPNRPIQAVANVGLDHGVRWKGRMEVDWRSMLHSRIENWPEPPIVEELALSVRVNDIPLNPRSSLDPAGRLRRGRAAAEDPPDGSPRVTVRVNAGAAQGHLRTRGRRQIDVRPTAFAQDQHVDTNLVSLRVLRPAGKWMGR
jgi:hypothetical protein